MAHSPDLAKLVAMREELRQLWTRTGVSAEQLVADLQAWLRKAEESGIAALQEFALSCALSTPEQRGLDRPQQKGSPRRPFLLATSRGRQRPR